MMTKTFLKHMIRIGEFIMKKTIRKMSTGFLAAGFIVTSLLTGTHAYASSVDTGAAAASLDVDYTLEEMLVYAIEDEYLAQTEYDIIMDKYGVIKPFSSIIKAEANHISLLEPLFEKYDVAIPEKDWESLVVLPETLEASYAIGVEAEIKNIEMYESFLKEDLPSDVRDVFEALMNASENHLSAFEKQLDRTSDAVGNRSGSDNGNRFENGSGNRNGNRNTDMGRNTQANRNTTQGTCLLD